MDYDEIKRELTRFSQLVADKQFDQANSLVERLSRSGMSAHDFASNTSQSERRVMKQWLARKRRSAPKMNRPSYKHYIVEMRYPKGSVPESDNYPVRILSGWDFKEDAQVAKSDEPDGGRDLKIRSGTYLRSRRGGLDPDHNANWAGH